MASQISLVVLVKFIPSYCFILTEGVSGPESVSPSQTITTCLTCSNTTKTHNERKNNPMFLLYKSLCRAFVIMFYSGGGQHVYNTHWSIQHNTSWFFFHYHSDKGDVMLFFLTTSHIIVQSCDCSLLSGSKETDLNTYRVVHL